MGLVSEFLHQKYYLQALVLKKHDIITDKKSVNKYLEIRELYLENIAEEDYVYCEYEVKKAKKEIKY